MYRDLVTVKTSTDEPSIPAGETRRYGPFVLSKLKALLYQLRATQVPADTVMNVYLCATYLHNDANQIIKPDVNDATQWTLIHSNDVFSADEPLIYEKCGTAAEWTMLEIIVGAGVSLDGLEIILIKQGWR
jgi:hypothetical protein